MRITASLIVRDEEANLDACLGCLAGVVDEIVVVDTGSRDRTPEIARAHGARLYHEPWREDFSLARNAALARATGDWVLYIDADERVTSSAPLHPVLEDSDTIAARVSFRASRRLTPYPEHRLFRNRPDIRFRGVIHETVLPDLQALMARRDGHVVDVPLAIEHLGYEGDLRPKHRRNHGLLHRAVADNPRRVYLWHALGECELGLGRAAAAEAAWRQGLHCVRGSEPRPGDALIYADLFSLHFTVADCTLPDIVSLIEEAGDRHPDDPLILWWTARQLTALRQYAPARVVLERLLALGPNGPPRAALGYDRRLFSEFAWGLLGVCWLCEEEPGRALYWLRRAQEANPKSREIQIKRALAEAQLRQA